MTKLQRDLGIVLILCFGSLTTLEAYCPMQENTLRFVSAVFRHGDRTVDTANKESFPTDPYRDYTYHPDGSGQLTIAGKKRSYEFGLMLRNRYKNFLGQFYYPPNVYAHSSLIPRTKMTLQLVCAALYPPVDVQKWSPVLPWQPVDFSFIYDAQDMLMFPMVCPVFYRLYRDMLKTPEIKTELAKFVQLMKDVSIYTGQNINTTYPLFLVYGTLYSEANYGLLLPQWTRSVFPNQLLEATIFQFKLFSYGQLNRLNGGTLLRRIINDMDKVRNGTLANRRLNLFSGHDLNVFAIRNALKINKDNENEVPKYTSSVIIELHEKNGEFFVKVLYYYGIPTKIEEKIIPGCEVVLCPYDKFVLLLSESTATNEEMECPEKMMLNFDNY